MEIENSVLRKFYKQQRYKTKKEMVKAVLKILKAENYFRDILEILKKETKTKRVIYVTTNKPYSHISNLLKENKISENNLFFIDCISKKVLPKIEETTNCIYLESPQLLTGISIAINESIKGIKGEKILLLDSLSVLMLYNNMETVSKFSNFLINKMRLYSVDTIILALESDSEKDILDQIKQMVDEIQSNKI